MSSYAQAGSSTNDIHDNVLIIKLGVYKNQISKEWKDALESRIPGEELDSLSSLKNPVSKEEKAWVKMIESKLALWNSFKDPLKIPFGNCNPPDTIYVLLGFTGIDDAFTYNLNTVCFDLKAFQINYGDASLPENSSRIDRIFAHEFTHLLHKEWAQKNKLRLTSFKDSVFWECLYEGIGMYRSLSKKWLPQNGILPEQTKNVLQTLYPQFVDHLITIQSPQNLSAIEKKSLIKNLSRGPVEKKWGAFTVAIWLALEANGDDSKLVYWINHGIDSIILLGQKYLNGENKTRFADFFVPR